jgi:hypothetical protein
VSPKMVHRKEPTAGVTVKPPYWTAVRRPIQKVLSDRGTCANVKEKRGERGLLPARDIARSRVCPSPM